MNRFAFVTGVDHRERLAAYLPANYAVLGEGSRDSRSFFVIGGHDSAGWTLDGFVLPRLASGLIFGEEVDEAAARAVVASSARPDAYVGLSQLAAERVDVATGDAEREGASDDEPMRITETEIRVALEDQEPHCTCGHPRSRHKHGICEYCTGNNHHRFEQDPELQAVKFTAAEIETAFNAWLVKACDRDGVINVTPDVDLSFMELLVTARNLEHVTSLPRPDFDMRVDYPERFSDGPY